MKPAPPHPVPVMRLAASRRLALRGLALLLGAGLAGCSSIASKAKSMAGGNTQDDARAQLKYPADSQGLALHVQASQRLNWVAGRAHTVVVIVVQASDAKPLVTLQQNAEALNKLLVGEPAKDPAIVSIDRFVVAPGADQTLVLARRDQARVLLVYAGYFDSLLPDRVRVLDIPVDYKVAGWVVDTYTAYVPHLQLNLQLADTRLDALTITGTSVAPPVTATPNSGTRPAAEPPRMQVQPL